MKLHEADRRAVDLLLDQAQSSLLRHGGPGYAASGGPARLERVERLLGVLDGWDVEEPPSDLAKRTLQRLPGSSAARPAAINRASSQQHFGAMNE